jgi:8-amino-7-oxononanoate synthase
MATVDEYFNKRITDNPFMRTHRKMLEDNHFLYHMPQHPASLNEVWYEGGKLLQLGSSNYLGLANDPRIKAAVIEAIDKYGTSCTSSRLLSGTRPLHLNLEEEVADFFDKEAALVFSTGYLANIGSIPALIGRHDEIFYDSLVHACLLDGIRLSFGRARKFAHNDLSDLRAKIAASNAPGKMIVIDSLYSMNADLAPLQGIVEIAEEYGAWIFLDDAHSAGLMGPGGRGFAHACGVEDQVQIIMGVFSKAFASSGGFIAGSKQLIDYLQFGARSYLFSNAIVPAQAAAALASLRILRQEPERAAKAVQNAEKARFYLRQQGWRCGGDGTHMNSILIGDNDATFKAAKALIKHGVWTGPAVAPGVPPGCALLRTCFPPTLTDAQFDFAMTAFEKVANDVPDALADSH